MKLKHPDAEVTVEASENTADIYRSQGWQADDDGDAPKDTPEDSDDSHS